MSDHDIYGIVMWNQACQTKRVRPAPRFGMRATVQTYTIRPLKNSPTNHRSTAPDTTRPAPGGCAGSEPFALRVLGDSMSPEFDEGVIIIVEPDGVIETGCYVVAEHRDEYMLRRLRVDGDRWYLDALNTRYPSVEIPGPTALKGRVIQRAGRRRRDRKTYL